LANLVAAVSGGAEVSSMFAHTNPLPYVGGSSI